MKVYFHKNVHRRLLLYKVQDKSKQMICKNNVSYNCIKRRKWGKGFLGVKKGFAKATFEIKDSRLAIMQDGYFLSNNAGSVIFYLACDSDFADLTCCHSPADAADCLDF